MKSTIMLFLIGIFISTTGYTQNMNFEDWDKDEYVKFDAYYIEF